jgi:hypothetical protein
MASDVAEDWDRRKGFMAASDDGADLKVRIDLALDLSNITKFCQSGQEGSQACVVFPLGEFGTAKGAHFCEIQPTMWPIYFER